MTKEKFVLEALKYLNYPAVRYKGSTLGQDVNGFDCSGFFTFLLKLINFPVSFHRHCNEYFDSFGIFVHKYQTGDIVFFSLNNGGMCPDHMGIMISEIEYIHSPGKDNKFIKTSKLKRKSVKSLDGQSHNQIYTVNPIGFKRLTVKNGRYQQIFLP